MKLCDPNCEAIQWLTDSYCWKTTLEASCAQLIGFNIVVAIAACERLH